MRQGRGGFEVKVGQTKTALALVRCAGFKVFKFIDVRRGLWRGRGIQREVGVVIKVE